MNRVDVRFQTERRSRTPVRVGIVGVVLVGMALALSSAVFAHSGATGIVKERMDAMKAIGKAMKSLTVMMRGQAEYDADTVKQAAMVVQSHAGQDMTALFPAGSDHPPSEALPAIWQDWPRFELMAGRLAVLAQGLERAADNGIAAASDSPSEPDVETLASLPANQVFTMLTQSCSSCHDAFRLKKN